MIRLNIRKWNLNFFFMLIEMKASTVLSHVIHKFWGHSDHLLNAFLLKAYRGESWCHGTPHLFGDRCLKCRIGG